MKDVSHALRWRKEGDVTVIRFRMVSVTESQLLDQACQDLKMLAETVGGKVLFSLSNVEAISSRGISALLSFINLLRSHGGQLKMCDVPLHIREAFRIIRLDKVVETHDSKAEAMAAFAKPQKPGEGQDQ